METPWIRALSASQLNGTEKFIGCDATVTDFWRFAMSDLRVNNVRGYLAEFLVAQAVGATGPRIEWDAYDLITIDGIKVEVKSSAYLQVWDQRQHSRISFGGLRGRTWTPQEGESAEATYNADVYVFAVQTATQHEAYDPLDVTQWAFYVLSRLTIEQLGYKSIGLPTLMALTEPTHYHDLASAIAKSGPPPTSE